VHAAPARTHRLEVRGLAQPSLGRKREARPRRGIVAGGSDLVIQRNDEQDTPTLRNEFPATLGAAASEHFAAVLGGHAGAEAVRFRTPDFTRLICTFHRSVARQMAGQRTQPSSGCQY